MTIFVFIICSYFLCVKKSGGGISVCLKSMSKILFRLGANFNFFFLLSNSPLYCFLFFIFIFLIFFHEYIVGVDVCFICYSWDR